MTDRQTFEPALRADGLSVSYGNFAAVRNFTFHVDAGEVFGLLGPNGAGKTSLIRALTTILTPNTGHASICGIPLKDATAVRRCIGVMPESNGYPRALTALRYLTFYGQLFGASFTTSQDVATDLLTRFGLFENRHHEIGTFSRGMRQRLGIARSLINQPRVLFLDEPTIGLDPAGREDVLAHLVSMARETNSAVLICSHLLDDIERICDRVAIMHYGRLAAIGSIDEVTSSIGVATTARVEVSPSQVRKVVALIQNSSLDCRAVPNDARAGEITIEFAAPLESANDLAEVLLHHEVPVQRIEVRPTRLSDAFLALTTGAPG